MNCEQARRQVEHTSVSAQEEAALDQHCRQCEACRHIREERRALLDAIQCLRDETAALGPSRRVEARVLAAVHAPPVLPHAAESNWRWFLAGLLVAATVFFCAVLLTFHRFSPAPTVRSTGIRGEAPFTPMPYVIPPAPYERTIVVRTEVPLQVLLSAGFQVNGEDLETHVLADVLYGEDGRILALRLVPTHNAASL